MSEYKSLSNCFDAEWSFNSYFSGIFDEINAGLEQLQDEILKNEDLYGKMSFHCGNYMPLERKMKDICNDKIPSSRNDLVKSKNNVLKAFWMKRKKDLEEFIAYCDIKVKESEAGYNEFIEKGYTDKFTMSTTTERRIATNAYRNYTKYIEEKKIAQQEIQKAANKISSFSKIEY